MTRALLLLTLFACGGAVEPAAPTEPAELAPIAVPLAIPTADASPEADTKAPPVDAHYEEIPPDPGCFTDFARCHDAGASE